MLHIFRLAVIGALLHGARAQVPLGFVDGTGYTMPTPTASMSVKQNYASPTITAAATYYSPTPAASGVPYETQPGDVCGSWGCGEVMPQSW